MGKSWLEDGATRRGGLWLVWFAASAPVAWRLLARGPAGAVAAVGLVLMPAWLGRAIARTRHSARSAPRAIAELDERERGILLRLDDAAEIADTNLGTSGTRRELRETIADAQRKLHDPERIGDLGAEMEAVASLLDRLVEEAAAERRQREVRNDLQSAIETVEVRPEPRDDLRLLE